VHPSDVSETDPDVGAAQLGDPAALDRLLRAYWPRAFRLALGITRHPATAEDAAQDALVLVAARVGSLRDHAAYGAWSTRIAVNAATAAVRRRRDHAALDDVAAATHFEDALADRIDVLRALGTVPLWLRVPLVLRYVDGLSSREIGRVLGAPPATIRFRLVLGRRRLAAALRVGESAIQETFA
jgi:RNA polymerase sigma-70 factor (ECF subfamily)